MADPLKDQWRRQKPISSPNITPDAIAHQLLLNGKPDQNCKIRNKKAVLKTDSHETILTPFTTRDLGDAISLLKNGKAPGLDNIYHEMIKCFGPTTRLWLLDMLNDCLKQKQIPNVWRKAKVVALLRPGKGPESLKSYRPIALLCSLYKLLERMILTRLQCKIEHRLIHIMTSCPHFGEIPSKDDIAQMKGRAEMDEPPLQTRYDDECDELASQVSRPQFRRTYLGHSF